MALTTEKYIIPSGSILGKQPTESAAFGDADLRIGLQESSTGLLSYAGTPFAVTSTTTFSHGAFTCRVTQYATGSESTTTFTLPATTGVTSPLQGISEKTYLGANSAGGSAIEMSPDPFTPAQRKTIVPLGVIFHRTATGMTESQFHGQTCRVSGGNFYDFLEMAGPVTKGFEIGVNTTASTLSIFPGRLMAPGVGLTTNDLAPNTIEFAARANINSYVYVAQDGFRWSRSTMDFLQYNTTGSTRANVYSNYETMQVVWQAFDGQIYVQYGVDQATNGGTVHTEVNWYKQPVPHWLWDIAAPIATITAENTVTVFDQSAVNVTIQQLQPFGRSWPYKTVTVTDTP